MTVKDLKELLQKYVSMIEDFDETLEVKTKCNTYGIGTPFLATYNGFIDLSSIAEDLEEKQMEEDFDDEDDE